MTLRQCIIRGDRVLRAFTLVEMLLALAMSAAIGTMVVLILGAAESGVSAAHDTRREALGRLVVEERLGEVARESAIILALRDDHCITWTGDGTRDQMVNLSELRRIQWNPESREVVVFEAPGSLDPADDVSYSVFDDFEAITDAVIGSSVFPARRLLTTVTSWNAECDSADIRAARLVRVRVELSLPDGDAVECIVIAALRGSQRN